MQLVIFILEVGAAAAPYVFAIAAGAYLEYKFGSKITARVAALEAKAVADAAKIKADAAAVVAKL